MPTEAEKKSLARELQDIKSYSQYYNRRAQCMSGFQAQSTRELREKGFPQADAGVLCLELLKHSATVDANPAAKAARPDQELLGPYKAISADKGFNPTDSNAEKLLRAYHEANNLPNVRGTYPTQQQPLIMPIRNNSKGTVEDFYLTQGSAFDAAFTVTILDAAKTGKIPAPSENANSAALQIVTDACFRNAIGTTIGQCVDTGVEQARQFIQKSPKVVAR